MSVSPDKPVYEIWEEVEFSIRIKNAGQARSVGFAVGVYGEDEENALAEAAVNSGLDANTSRDIKLRWRVESKWRPTLSAAVDRAGEVAESDERNNAQAVAANPLIPPFDVRDIEWSPKNPGLDEDVTFWARVKNSSDRNADYDVVVAFYMNGENIYWTSLDDLRAGRTEQVSSESWRAREGTYKIAVAVYPAEYLDYRVNTAWRRFDEKYAISFAENTYNHTALPNLSIGNVNVTGRRQASYTGGATPTPSERAGFYLDAEYWLSNKSDDGRFSPPVNRPFEIQIKWDKGPVCPFIGKTMSQCFISTSFNSFGSGAERREQARSSNPLTLPTRGVIEYGLIIVVDPNDAVKETNDNDNRYELRVTVDSGGTVRQTLVVR